MRNNHKYVNPVTGLDKNIFVRNVGRHGMFTDRMQTNIIQRHFAQLVKII